MVAIAAGGGLVWRRTNAKEVSTFLPNVQADLLTIEPQSPLASSRDLNALNQNAWISSAIDAIQGGIHGISFHLNKPVQLLKEGLGRGSLTRLNKSLCSFMVTEQVPKETNGLDGGSMEDEHVRKYGGRLLGGSDERTTKATAAQEALLHQATVLDGCLDGGQYLPIFYILKEELILSPVDISLTMGFTAMPFILKPGLAVASDRLPIFGRKRTPYLAGSMILVAGTYAGASVAQSYASLLGFLSMNTFGRCLMSAVLQGMVVEVARKEGKDEISAVVGDFFGLKTCAALFSALFSSFLIGKLGSRSALRMCACAPLLMLAGIGRCEREGGELAFVLSNEQTRAWAAQNSMGIPSAPLRSETTRLSELLHCICNPALWGPLLFLVVYSAGPGYDDSLYFFYINRLRFRPAALGRLKMAQELAKLIGILVYRYALRRIPDRQLVFGLTAVSLPLYLTPLLLTTGAYHSIPLSPQTLAVSGELVREVVLNMQVLPVFSRFADMGPPGLESTSVSLLYAMLQTSRAMNKVTSAGMSHLLGVTAHNFHHLSFLIVVCGACATLPLPLAKFIPEDATWTDRLSNQTTLENDQNEIETSQTEQLPMPDLSRLRWEDEDHLDVRLPQAAHLCEESRGSAEGPGCQRCAEKAAMPAG